MIYVALGDIILEVPQWPTSLDRRQGHNYAEHQPVNCPPLLQSTGRNLIEYSLAGKLHRQFGRTPSQDLMLLREAMNGAKVLPLVFGNGEYPGKFVITDLGENTDSAGPDSDQDAVTVTLSLREYVENDRLAAPIRSQLAAAKGLFREAVEGVRKWLQ